LLQIKVLSRFGSEEIKQENQHYWNPDNCPLSVPTITLITLPARLTISITTASQSVNSVVLVTTRQFKTGYHLNYCLQISFGNNGFLAVDFRRAFKARSCFPGTHVGRIGVDFDKDGPSEVSARPLSVH
jgi:hypothetical protein